MQRWLGNNRLIGTRRGLRCRCCMSLASISHALLEAWLLLPSAGSAGVGEAGNFPSPSRPLLMVSNKRRHWRPDIQHGRGSGALIAPPLGVWIILNYAGGLHLVTGSLSFLWMIAWLLFYEQPEKHPG